MAPSREGGIIQRHNGHESAESPWNQIFHICQVAALSCMEASFRKCPDQNITFSEHCITLVFGIVESGPPPSSAGSSAMYMIFLSKMYLARDILFCYYFPAEHGNWATFWYFRILLMRSNTWQYWFGLWQHAARSRIEKRVRFAMLFIGTMLNQGSCKD